MARKRRAFTSLFKAKVALDAVKGLKTVGELANQHKVHPTQVVLWKKQLLDSADSVFEGSVSKSSKSDEPATTELYEQIGKLNMQLEWLKKKVAEHGG